MGREQPVLCPISGWTCWCRASTASWRSCSPRAGAPREPVRGGSGAGQGPGRPGGADAPSRFCGILDTAEPFKEVSERRIKKVPVLRGKTIVNLFFEASTRTRISFEFAEKRLSADTVNIGAVGSSVSKGETLVDTARNLEAMSIDMVVIRHWSAGAAAFLAARIPSNVINAGDGAHEHPTQGLLDILTLRDHFGRLKGLRVCIVGDVLHSRVARSNIYGLVKLGARVAVCGPRTLLPAGIEELGARVFGRVEEAVEWAEAHQRAAAAAGTHAGRLRALATGSTTASSGSPGSAWSGRPGGC